MKLRKKFILCAIVAAILLSSAAPKLTVPAMADTPITQADALNEAITLYENLYDKEIEVPLELLGEGYSKNVVKSAMLGYINLGDREDDLRNTNITKQDFVSVLYKTVVHFDDSFSLSADEANSILNNCYDNAYINEANRIPYAFMMKQGIITENYGSKPDSFLTKEECELLIQSVKDRFIKNIAINVMDNEISIGANIDTVTDAFGAPNRIDKTEYGFEWYVYNSDYNNYFMVGVEADRVCAFYSNSDCFEMSGISVGSNYSMTADYAGNRCFRFVPTKDGKVESMLYNSAYRSVDNSAAVKRSKSLILLDMINAYRAKNDLPIYAEDSGMSAQVWLANMNNTSETDDDSISQKGYDVFSVYEQFVKNENEILTQPTDHISPVGITTDTDLSGSIKTVITSDSEEVAKEAEAQTVELKQEEYTISEPKEIKTPVLSQPQTETRYDEGDDIVIELEEQAASKYHIEMFDVESDEYVVNEYVVTDSTEIRLPHNLFSPGSDYRLIVSSVTYDGEALCADEVLISYGSMYDDGVEIVTPYNNGVLDGDTLEVTWKSGRYHDFGVDLYNQEGELIVSKIVEGAQETVIDGLDDGGKYFLYVTALRRGTRVAKAQAVTSFTLQLPEPVINEIVLEKDDTYYYVYEDNDLGLLYFYDEEIIDVEENGEKVKKKKIIQKQVKATRGYRRLAENRTKPTSTSGDPNVMQHSVIYDGTKGGAIVSEAAKYLGVPYVWGGETPEGFDCSGLVLYVMNTLGINVNRVAEDQFGNGTAVNRDELEPGDLVFFEQNGYIHHVGIYAGDGLMIHAPHTGDVVKYQSIDDPYYVKEYAGARRVY